MMALQKKVLLNPGSVYDYTGSNAVRISYAYVDLPVLEKDLRISAYIAESCS